MDFVEISDVVDLTVEDAVITESVELLGQQFGETIDAIVRDTLSSVASATNASNGSNGRDVAVVKSSLIEFKLLTDDAEDKNAQAEQYALAA